MLDTASLDEAREALTCPSKGFFVIRGFYSADAIGRYRQECEDFLPRAQRIYARINVDGIFDYVHPRSHDAVERTYRLYQFPHNPHSAATERILEKAIAIRNTLEEPWMADEEYHRVTAPLQDHFVITKYVPGTGRLPLHRDTRMRTKYPQLQSLVLLSQPGVDYEGGEFVLYPEQGRATRIVEELGVRMGDMLLFDRILRHEVETTLPGKTVVGRWSAVMGSRADRHSISQYVTKRLLFHARVFPVWNSLRWRLKGLAGSRVGKAEY